MVWIASGSVTSAITRRVPPHSGQTEISISNTRLSRSAQLSGERVIGAYRFNDLVEGLVRYQEAKCDNCRGVPNDDRDLDRFEVGLSFFLGPNDRMGRLQLNYVSVSGDEEDYNGEAGGGDNRYNAILGQLQLYF